jgi:UDP-N-acetylmuramate--alanine ligase
MLRSFAGERRTVVLFQPHRFTRTQALWNEFASAFGGADVLLLTDIYAASEAQIDGVDSRRLAGAIADASGKSVLFAGDLSAAGERLFEIVRAGDVVLTLGAGPVHRAGEALLGRLEARA